MTTVIVEGLGAFAMRMLRNSVSDTVKAAAIAGYQLPSVLCWPVDMAESVRRDRITRIGVSGD